MKERRQLLVPCRPVAPTCPCGNWGRCSRLLPGSCIFVSSLCLYKSRSFPGCEAGVVQGSLKRRAVKQNEEGNVVGVGEQGGWAQPCHPPVLPQIYFPRGVTPQSSHGWGPGAQHLVLQEPR